MNLQIQFKKNIILKNENLKFSMGFTDQNGGSLMIIKILKSNKNNKNHQGKCHQVFKCNKMK